MTPPLQLARKLGNLPRVADRYAELERVTPSCSEYPMHPLTRFRVFRTLAILAACQPASSSAQTLVAPGDLTDLPWTQAGSPYRIRDGNVTVPVGATLTVEAGVRVEVGPELLIFIEGALDAQGLAASPGTRSLAKSSTVPS